MPMQNNRYIFKLNSSIFIFNIFINCSVSSTYSGIACTLSKFADDTELSGVADGLEGQDAIQRAP